MDLDLGVEIGGATPRPLMLRNPVMTAAGTWGYGVEYARLVPTDRIGALVTKSTTLRPRAGAPMPRWIETPSGMLNAIGLANPGIERVLRRYAPRWLGLGAPVVVSIAGEATEDYRELALLLEETEGVAGIEVNVSCPNVREGGVLFGSDPEQAAAVARAVRGVTTLPMIVKLTPNAERVADVARAVQAEGADAVALINTLAGLVIDVEARRPALGNRTGGLSGPAIRPVAVRIVWEVAGVVEAPVIGLGGIGCAEDALEFIMAGASAVQVGSASFARPTTAVEVADGIAAWMREHGVERLDAIRGCVRPREDA